MKNIRILFCFTNFGFLRNFQSTVAALASRGHQVHLVTDRSDTTGGMTMVTDLAARYPTISYEISPPVPRGLWFAFTSVVRLTLDYWRYLEPRFAQAVQLRARAERQVPRLSVAVVHLPLLGTAIGRRLLSRALRAIERLIPVRAEVTDLLQRHNPDVLVVTPLLYFGSRQVDHIRAGRALGVPTILGVGSWDHLTTKGLIHEIPDHVMVWNELQKAEASELHGVPAERVIVTGAQAYDHWFERQPGTMRSEFCRKVGFEDSRPYLLYLCSSPFITPHEVPFVRRWIDAIRASPVPALQSVGILIRPHPQNAEQWWDADLSAFANVAIWPQAGANPIDDSAKAEYFDSIFHSHAVIGVNTSALIESGIIGRRVYSILVDEFSATQEGTLHFHHLKNVEGGLLRLASSLEEHVAQLAPALASPAAAGEDEKIRGFVQAFVRPHGLDVPATPRFVEAVERIASEAACRARGSMHRLLPRNPAHVRIATTIGRAFIMPFAFAAMVANIERDRWWSWTLQATRPPRLVLRGARRWTTEQGRRVRRIGRLAAAVSSSRTSTVIRTARRLRRRVWHGSQSAARRLLGGTPGAE